MRNYLSYLTSALIALTLAFIACGGGGKKAVESVTVSPTTLTLSVGRTQPLTATILPKNATNKDVAWSTSAPAIADVSNDGNVTGVAPGSATITVTTADGGETATCAVTVIVPVASVNLDKSEITLLPGQYYTLNETVLPPDATIKDVTWSTSDGNVATVSSSGVVTAMGAGQAVITATSKQDDTKKDECKVNVPLIIPVTGITLNETELALNVSETATLHAIVTPADATNPAVAWSSGAPAIADVSQTGEVTALTPGKTTIKVASVAYPAVVSECAVTVTAAIPSGSVYVAGYEANLSYIDVAKLWVNGVPQNLSDGTNNVNAQSVFVAGSDVYVAGYETNAQYTYVAKLWVNGVPQNLSDGTRMTYAQSVFVSGGDVYVAGYEHSGGAQGRNIAKLWVNGLPQDLTDGTNHAYAYSVFVSGGDVYVAGRERNAQNVDAAKLWVNGVPQNLSETASNAYSVFVSGNDVYVAGSDLNAQNASAAILWKNGVPQNLSSANSFAYSVFVSGNDVYVAGHEISASGTVAKLWVNGVSQNLSGGVYARSVFVSGDDVYVAGMGTNAQYNYVAKLWVNGVSQDLSDGNNDASAQSIFVTPLIFIQD